MASKASRSVYRRVPRDGGADLHRPSAAQLDGLCLMEGPQGVGDRAQADLPRHRCRRRRKGADGLRCRLLGPALSCHRSELAARPERGHPVLCLARRGLQDRIHHKRHRGAKLKAAAGCQGQGPLPRLRCRHQAAPTDLEPVRERVENAAT